MPSSAMVLTRTARSTVRPSVGRSQARGLRIGSWSSFIDQSSQRSPQRQSSPGKTKDIDDRNRPLLWDRQPFISLNWDRMSFMSSAATACKGSSRPSGRTLKTQKMKSTGRGVVSDPSRSAFLNQFHIRGFRFQSFSKWTVSRSPQARSFEECSGFSNTARTLANAFSNYVLKIDQPSQRMYLHTSGSVNTSKRSNDDSADEAVVPEDSAYDIDPITNRKVYKSESPSKSAQFLDHVAGFAKMAAPNVTKSIGNAEARSPGQSSEVVHLDGLSAEPKVKSSTTSNSEKPQSYLSGVVEEGIASAIGSIPNASFYHDETTKYAPYHADEPDGKYKELHSTKPLNVGLADYEKHAPPYDEGFRSHEPDGLYKVLQAKKDRPEGYTDFDETTDYNSGFRAHEPDGLYKIQQTEAQAATASFDYDQKANYKGPYRSHEPDGMYKLMQTEVPVIPGLSDHDSKVAYDAFRAHEPDGKYKEMQARMPVIPGLSEHDSKVAYEAVRAYEPDGKYKVMQSRRAYTSGLNDHDSKTAYDRPFQAHEPNGKYQYQAQAKISNKSSSGALGDFDAKARYTGPYKSYEPDGKYKAMQKQQRRERAPTASGNFDSKHDYTIPFKSHEPDGKYKVLPKTKSARNGLDEYEEHRGYGKPVRAHEPDGMYKPLQETAGSRSSIDEYEQNQDYRSAVRAHEPDGLYKPLQASQPPRTGLEDFEEKNAGYDKPVKAHEPDGMYKPLQASQSSQDGLDTYDRDHDYEEGVRAHEPDGMYKPLQASQPSRSGLDEYEAEHAGYDKPVRAHEPDGMYKVLQASKASHKGLDTFENRHPGHSGAVMAHEPDGMYKTAQEEYSSVNRSEFDAKHPYGPVFSEEPDGKYKKNQYVTFQFQGLNGKPMDKLNPDSEATRSCLDQEGFSEPSCLGRSARVPSAPLKTGGVVEPSLSRVATRSKFSKFDLDDADKTEDLDLLRASDIRARSGILKGPRKDTYAEKIERRQALTVDFEKTILMDDVTSVRPNNISSIKLDTNSANSGEKASQRKVTGNFVRDFPEEFSKTWTAKPNGNLVPNSNGIADDNAMFKTLSPGVDSSHEQEIDRKILINDRNSRKGSASRMQSSLERQQTETAKTADGKSEENSVTAANPNPKVPQSLETSFTETSAQQGEGDLSVSVSSYGACEKYSPKSRKARLGRKQKDIELLRELRGIYEETYGTIDTKHRQAISPQVQSADPNDRLREKEQEELGALNLFDAQSVFGTTEESLQAEIREGQYFINDRYMDIAKIHARRASEIPTADQPVAAATDTTDTTTSYKILAYDPTMQTINTASTTSIVPDTNPILTPAEVLLRLSNPSKFFPHFAPLQDEGYEIVSGSGDVLVFRKVRAATSVSQTADKVQDGKTNPIDGTQGTPRPPIGNFASPTGFVNHDLPPNSEARTPFVSGINMRRGEPVFSCSQRTWTDEPKPKPKRGRRGRKVAKRIFIGAGWLAISTYAAGVVIEFFRSGGSDGLGAVGF